MRNTVVAVILAAALLGAVWLYNDSQQRMQSARLKSEQQQRNAEYQQKVWDRAYKVKP